MEKTGSAIVEEGQCTACALSTHAPAHSLACAVAAARIPATAALCPCPSAPGVAFPVPPGLMKSLTNSPTVISRCVHCKDGRGRGVTVML